VNGRFEAFGTAVGRVENEAAARLQAIGTAVGRVENEAAARLQTIGTAIGHIRNTVDAISGIARAFSSVSEQKLNRIQQGLTKVHFALGRRVNPDDIVLGTLDTRENLDLGWSGFADTSAKERASSTIQGDRSRAAVVITLGQSNAANHGGGHYTATKCVDNFNVYDGSCYHAADPLLGASGEGGNFATRFGDMVIERGLFDRVIIAPIAIGGTTVEQWAEEGLFNRRILALVRRLHDASLTPDFILWQQGEGNRGLVDPGGHQYCKNLLEVVQTFRRFGVDAPFFIALAGDDFSLGGPAQQYVRLGQLSAIHPELGTYFGPDTNIIGREHCSDPVHLTESGISMLAKMWVDTLTDFLAWRTCERVPSFR
jgi:Carbohydrate esterase, sialic acid-specific acetylesterase